MATKMAAGVAAAVAVTAVAAGDRRNGSGYSTNQQLCAMAMVSRPLHGIVVGSRVRGRSRDARPGVSSKLPVTSSDPRELGRMLAPGVLERYRQVMLKASRAPPSHCWTTMK
jgi:hypothetical protein